jgi:hypothetical protein
MLFQLIFKLTYPVQSVLACVTQLSEHISVLLAWDMIHRNNTRCSLRCWRRFLSSNSKHRFILEHCSCLRLWGTNVFLLEILKFKYKIYVYTACAQWKFFLILVPAWSHMSNKQDRTICFSLLVLLPHNDIQKSKMNNIFQNLISIHF